MPSAEELWNQTYVQGMSEHTEGALDAAYQRLSQRPIKYPTDCGVMCRHVHNYLSTMGVKSRILSGQFIGGLKDFDPRIGAPSSRDHVWLEVDDHIIDPTATQFRGHVNEFKPEHYRPDDVD